ncbi:MAG TPA: FG-GAP-like repeat-containing protein [Planctomycetota bacterium]|jgi:hypothetical protein|nr:FG-GAP-like repeat-containing protein [Planctomycetota bacterium]
MRHWIPALWFLFELGSAAPAQQFGLTRQMLPGDADYTWAVALGDVDGDGDLDALLGNGGSMVGQPNRLYVNGGTGAFADVTPTNLPTLTDVTYSVSLGDLDGDGDLDAFVGNIGQDRLHLNDGTGIFTDATATNLPALVDSTYAAALGDVDGDGDLDAFVGNGSLQQDRLHLNDGTGVFTDASATNLPAFLGGTRAIALGDVDGDGDLDAFLGSVGPPNRLYLNGGTGVFTNVTATNLPFTGPGYTFAVAFGDVDGDGDLDAFLGKGSNVADALLLNGGTGVFAYAPPANFPTLFDATTGVALGDVDGDGDLDVLVGNTDYASGGGPGQNRLYRNGGTGVFADVTATSLPALPQATQAVALGDMDGDGDLDALVGNGPYGAAQQNRLQLNDGTGVFTDVTAANLPALLDSPRAVALGDVDGDGDLDGLFGGDLSHRLDLNNGSGVFADATAQLPPLTGGTYSIALGDVDGDGDLDVYVGSGGQDRLYLNGGTGVFTDATATNLPALLDVTGSVALGDVDGDGDLDVFVGNGGQDRLYLNGGTGVFADATATSLPALLDNTVDVALGDVDGDGDLDAFVANYGQESLLLNGGTGVFTDVTGTNLPALLDNTRAIALGDVDGDSDLDALAGNLQGQNRLLLNGGTGVFTDATAANLPALVDLTFAVALGDMDGDGDLDAFVGIYQGQNRLHLNGGTGIFTDATGANLPALLDNTNAVALGDGDGDGDLDVLVGNYFGQSRLYTNLSRGLAWVGIPRTGKPLELEVRGPGGGPWVLGASLASANLLLPPFGALRLDPSTLFLVGGGALDSQGRASVSFLVPSNPFLVGVSVYWQAVVGAPLLFTNLEITTATNL